MDDSGDLSTGDLSDVTVADGSYTITGIPPGTYDVREVIQTDWTCSDPNAQGVHADVVFTSSDTLTDNDFGNWEQASKSGRKFEDMNADGDDEAGSDPGLSVWTIRAYEDTNADGDLDQAEYDAGAADSDTTAVTTGAYSLDLNPGDYIIVEVLQSGWTQSAPGTGVLDAGLTPSGETLGANGYAITLESGESDTGNDFGNWTPTEFRKEFTDPRVNGTPLRDWHIVNGGTGHEEWVPVGEQITWTVTYYVPGPSDSGVPWTDVVLKDRFGAELDHVDAPQPYDPVLSDPSTYTYNASEGTVTFEYKKAKKMPQLRFIWDIGVLADGQSATLTFEVATRVNPGQGKKAIRKWEFTSCGVHVLNSGANLFEEWTIEQFFSSLRIYP